MFFYATIKGMTGYTSQYPLMSQLRRRRNARSTVGDGPGDANSKVGSTCCCSSCHMRAGVKKQTGVGLMTLFLLSDIVVKSSSRRPVISLDKTKDICQGIRCSDPFRSQVCSPLMWNLRTNAKYKHIVLLCEPGIAPPRYRYMYPQNICISRCMTTMSMCTCTYIPISSRRFLTCDK